MHRLRLLRGESRDARIDEDVAISRENEDNRNIENVADMVADWWRFAGKLDQLLADIRDDEPNERSRTERHIDRIHAGGRRS